MKQKRKKNLKNNQLLLQIQQKEKHTNTLKKIAVSKKCIRKETKFVTKGQPLIFSHTQTQSHTNTHIQTNEPKTLSEISANIPFLFVCSTVETLVKRKELTRINTMKHEKTMRTEQSTIGRAGK